MGMHFCRVICNAMDTHPIYLSEIVRRDDFYLGYGNALGVGVVGVWIDTNKNRVKRVWRVQ